MRRWLFVLLGLVPALFTSACLEDFIYDSNKPVLDANLNSCLGRLTKDDLIMNIGLPTARVSLESGEIWIYELSEGGITISETTTQQELFSQPKLVTTTRSAAGPTCQIRIQFGPNGKMKSYSYSGAREILLAANRNPFFNLKY
jgi:hypothetical protein